MYYEVETYLLDTEISLISFYFGNKNNAKIQTICSTNFH